jgi:hypothetical protein
MGYKETIGHARLIDDVDSTLTTGDIEYDGTALEIGDKNGTELFHVVIDDAGDTQILFFASEENYRIPVKLMERILNRAKETVRRVEE